ncbi:polysaccharide (de)acetylase [Flavobacterium sp. RSB2_4_14]|uniref:polysaccharide (de)acetylase n=1 Tax=Flavobacterium sp. RSB2_4_14 TaxID=3447665 RepID=UPI003F3E7360
MIKKFKSKLGSNFLNIQGWTTQRKIVVFESDDWGSIRIPSRDALSTMVKSGLINPEDQLYMNDSLADESDITHLFELLLSYKDFKGNHPVFTANCILANPDFNKIRESNFTEYHYELFTKTLENYPAHKNCFNLWLEGFRNGVFFPQYHGREHVNVARWMNNLNLKNRLFTDAFDYETFAVKPKYSMPKNQKVVAALDFDLVSELSSINKIVTDGYGLFSSVFGFQSKSFIAPNYIWHPETQKTLKNLGVKYIQGSRFQNVPIINSQKYNRKFHFTGEHGNENQKYIVRNCYFEPTLSKTSNSVDECLKSISNAFFWNTPAVICTHRFNYVGYINEKNRDKNLPLLRELIEKIVTLWPDVEFMTTVELGELISNDK